MKTPYRAIYKLFGANVVDPHPSSPPKETRFFSFKPLVRSWWIYPLAACAFLLLAFSTRKITDYDLGFHLKSGEWICQHHSVPHQDYYTYTVPGHEYFDAHWFYELVVFGLYQLWGYSSLTLMNVAVLFLVFTLVYWRIRLATTSHWISCLVFFTAIMASEERFLVRPEIYSWLFLSATLLVLELRARKLGDFLYLLPLIQLVWANMEGLFVLGWTVCAAYVVGVWWNDRTFDAKAAKWAGISVAADLLNPNFFKGMLYPFSLLSTLRGGNILKQTLGELHSPWYFLQMGWKLGIFRPFLYFYMGFGLLTFLFFLFTFRQRRFYEGAVLAVFFYFSAVMVRNVSIFMVACAPIGAVCFNDFLGSKPGLQQRINGLFRNKAVPFLFALFVGSMGLRVVHDAYYISGSRDNRFGVGVEENSLPIQAMEFLIQKSLDGRILNYLNLGGWLDWRAPQPTFIDGRLDVMGEDLYSQFVQSGSPGGLGPILAQYRPQLVIFEPYLDPSWDGWLKGNGEWRLVYVDPCAAIYAAKGYAEAVPNLSWDNLVQDRGLRPISDEQAAFELMSYHPSNWRKWWDGVFQTQLRPFGLFHMAGFAMDHGQYEAAKAFYLETLRQSQGQDEESYHNLGALFLKARRYELAKICFEKALRLKPDYSQVLRAMSLLGRL